MRTPNDFPVLVVSVASPMALNRLTSTSAVFSTVTDSAVASGVNSTFATLTATGPVAARAVSATVLTPGGVGLGTGAGAAAVPRLGGIWQFDSCATASFSPDSVVSPSSVSANCVTLGLGLKYTDFVTMTPGGRSPALRILASTSFAHLSWVSALMISPTSPNRRKPTTCYVGFRTILVACSGVSGVCGSPWLGTTVTRLGSTRIFPCVLLNHQGTHHNDRSQPHGQASFGASPAPDGGPRLLAIGVL